MKNIKFVAKVFVGVALGTALWMSPISQVSATNYDEIVERKPIQLDYDSVKEVPSILPECDVLTVDLPEDKTWERGTILNSVVSREHRCTITFSVPELYGINPDVLEQKKYPGQKSSDSTDRYIMVTVEPFEPDESFIGRAELLFYDCSKGGSITVKFYGHSPYVILEDGLVASLSMFSNEVFDTLDKAYPLNDKSEKILTNIYSCYICSIGDFGDFRLPYNCDGDITFSYGEVFLSYIVRRDLMGNISLYHSN